MHRAPEEYRAGLQAAHICWRIQVCIFRVIRRGTRLFLKGEGNHEQHLLSKMFGKNDNLFAHC